MIVNAELVCGSAVCCRVMTCGACLVQFVKKHSMHVRTSYVCVFCRADKNVRIWVTFRSEA